MSVVLIYGVFILLYLWLVWKSGKTYPILYLFIFTYFIQYIFSTYLIYNDYRVLSVQMPITQEKYFSYILPALGSLFAGVFLFHRDIDIRSALQRIDKEHAAKLGWFLLALSYGLDLIQFAGVTFLDSLISFTTYLKYVAAFCFLFTGNRFHYIIIAIVYLQLAASVLKGGVFISFFIWSTFLYFFVTLKYRVSFWIRSCFILVAVPILILVQTVKDRYREETWTGNREGGIELFSQLAKEESKKSDGDPFAESKGVISTVGRLTQGWHLGLTLRRVPAKEPFANGGEMAGDITSSIIPRIFFPDKKMVNSQEKFYKYTGHKLRGSTSMSVGVIGDFYINYGRVGSYIMLFILGAVIVRLHSYFMKKYVLKNPINIIWIPFILSYLIRANNDFYIFFNGLVKGFLIFLMVHYISQRYLSRKTRPAKVIPKPTFS